MSEGYGAKKVVGRVQAEGGAREPLTLAWVTFEGSDGAIHCKPKGTAPRRMRAAGKEWRPNPKSVREMERRRLGKIKGGALDDKSVPV